MRAQEPRPFTCTTCEGDITGVPVFHVGLAFCCAGCVADGPCTCSYDPPGAARLRHSRPAPAGASGEWSNTPVEPGIPVNLPLHAAAAPMGDRVAAPVRATRRQARRTLTRS
jgi:hypothetical protein